MAEAVDLIEPALAQEPLDADLRYLVASLYLDAGQPGPAAREARAALYLDPALSVAHLLIGHAMRALGQSDASVRSYRRAARGLADLAGDIPVMADDRHSAAHLSALATRIATEGGAR